MAVSELLRLVVEADTRGAVKGMEKVGSTAQRELSRSQQNLDRWGNRLTTVGAGMVTFGTVAAYGLGRAAQSASDLGEAVNASNVVFGDAVGIIDDYAKDSATSMGLSEAAFRTATTQMGAQLKNLGFSQSDAAESSVKLTQRAADMASVFNTDVTQATEAIGAALRGERDPIERFGVTINEAAIKAQAMEMGLAGATGQLDANSKALATEALILEQTNDIADDFINTSDGMANKQRIVAAQFEDLKASIGEGALPVLEDLLGVAQGGIGAFQGLNDATGGFVGKAATIGTIGTLGAGGLSLLVGQAIKMRDNFALARDAVGGFVGRVRGMPSSTRRAALGLAGFTAAFIALGRAFQEDPADIPLLERDLLDFGRSGTVAGEAADLLGTDLGKLEDDLGSLSQTSDRFGLDKIEEAFSDLTGLESGTQETKRHIDELDEALASLAARDPSAAAAALARFREALSPAAFEELTSHLNDYDAALAENEVTQDLAAGAAEGVAGAYQDQADATDNATSALKEYADTLRAQFDPLFAYQDAVTANKDALDEEAEAQAELDLLRASGQATADELKEAEDRLAAAHGDVQSSAVDLAGSEAELMAMLAEGGRTADEMRAELDRLEGQGYLSAAAAADLRRKIDAIESKTVEANLLDGVSSVVDRINEKMKQLHDRDLTVRTNYITTGQGGSGGIPLGRAHGGPVDAGRLYEVAEQGRAELLSMGGRTYLIPGSSGTVIPADAMAAPTAGMGGGGGAVTNIINLTGPIGSEAEAARWVGRALKAAGASGQSLTVNGRRVA